MNWADQRDRADDVSGLRVLMTCDTVGGVWTFALQLAGWLCERGARVVLASMGAAPSTVQQRQASDIAGLELWQSTYRLEWMVDPWEDIQRAGEWLLLLDRQIRPDIVHLNGYCHGALAFRAPPIVAGHSCVLSWWEAVRREPAPAALARSRREVRRGIQAARLVTAPSRAMLEGLVHHYGPLRRTEVIHNGRAEKLFRPSFPKQPFVLTAGRLWDEAKNVAALSRAAAAVRWPIVVAGQSRHPEGGTWNEPNLRLLGNLPEAELAQWMGRASIFALPARYEPFGLSILEAALSGCALVLGDIASLQEIWGEAARYVPPDDSGRLAEVLEELIRQPAERQRLGAAARQKALDYSLERMGRAYSRAYAASSTAGELWSGRS